jgi:hypothetical protein
MTFLGHLLANRHAGENTLVWHADGLDAPDTIQIESPAFADGAPMPKRTAGKPVGDNSSPPLAWTGIPDDTRELVLIVEDLDVPFARPFTHAVARLDASLTGVSEGDLNAPSPVMARTPTCSSCSRWTSVSRPTTRSASAPSSTRCAGT